jgi:predicted RNA binding protein with dsRBD fold (UPF0201 family)
MSIQIKGKVPIHPTEDREKVIRCILNLFPQCEYNQANDEVDFSTSEMDHFRDLLKQQQIRDTAAMVLQRNLKDGRIRFHLNKQAAFMEKVNFTDGDSNLGDLFIEITDGAMEFLKSIGPDLD